MGFFEADEIFTTIIPSEPLHGFAAYGATSYGIADYDNLVIQDSSRPRIIAKSTPQVTVE